MPRAIWSGTISFGLVNVPVKLYSAVRDRSVRFHQLHAPDSSRIQQRRFCAQEDREVPNTEIVKGYEIAPDRYVVVEPDELAALQPVASRAVEIEDFVGIEEIDPIYLNHPYILAPAEGAAKPYSLLLEAMRRTGKVAIARVVLRSKEYLVAIRPWGEALLMSTMSFSDEIQDAHALPEIGELDASVNERELDIACTLVESISQPFEIGKYHDSYRDALLDLIDRKAAGEQVAVGPPPEPARLQAPDLMSALEASLEEVRARRGKTPAGEGRRRAAGAAADGDGKPARKARATGAAADGDAKPARKGSTPKRTTRAGGTRKSS
jgi:DNA end-binding protein Ku